MLGLFATVAVAQAQSAPNPWTAFLVRATWLVPTLAIITACCFVFAILQTGPGSRWAWRVFRRVVPPPDQCVGGRAVVSEPPAETITLVTPSDWHRLETSFTVMDAALEGMWQQEKGINGASTSWQILGADERSRERCDARAREAGALLLHSRYVCAAHPGLTKEADPLARWLNTVQKFAATSGIHGIGTGEGKEHTFGSISGLPSACVVTCAQLAARELEYAAKGRKDAKWG